MPKAHTTSRPEGLAKLTSRIAVLLVATIAPLYAAEAAADLNLPAQPLGESLRNLGNQTKTNLLFDPAAVKNRQAPAIENAASIDEALKRLLDGSGLTYKYIDAHTVTVLPADKAGKMTQRLSSSSGVSNGQALIRVANSDAQPGASERSDATFQTQGTEDATKSIPQPSEETDEAASDVIVTGTHIRGEAPVGSSLKVYTRTEIAESGAATVDQFARQMVENFSAVDAVANAESNVGFSRFGLSSLNNGYQGASFDLHGLGPSATLTLINGHRIAQGGVDGSIADISQIPLSAVDHIEVLGDGASAIYGADAVAGVVNIVTRKDFDGAESSFRFANATSGGASELVASQLLGKSWNGGNAFVNYEFDRQGGLDASDRSYIPDQNGIDLLVPQNRRNSVDLSGDQDLGADTRMSGDAFFSRRKFFTATDINGTALTYDSAMYGNAETYGATVSVDHQLFRDWDINLTGGYGKQEQTFTQVGSVTFGPISQVTNVLDNTDSGVASVDLLGSGSLFSLPGGLVKAALGLSYRAEEFDTFTLNTINDVATPINTPAVRRHVSSAYAEFFIPLIGESNATPWTHALQLSAAVRYDDYSDFGSTTNPKFGLSWEPVVGIALRATYGTSFRAPLLNQIGAPVIPTADPVANPGDPAGVSDVILINGGNPGLKPEKSTSYTMGFDVKPTVLPNFRLAATYFHINFRDRISTPPLVGQNYFDDPAVASFLTLNPPLSLVQSYFNAPGFTSNYPGGPEDVYAIFDQRQANISRSTTAGVDVTTSYNIPTSVGQFGLTSAIDRLLKNEFQSIAGTPATALLDTFGEPTRWKVRTGVSWHRGGFSAMLTGNYVSSYQNTLATPPESVASWTTGDLFLSYATGASVPQYFLRNWNVSLSVLNFTNRDPPYVDIPVAYRFPGQPGVPFDPTNASPVGRLLSLQTTRRW